MTDASQCTLMALLRECASGTTARQSHQVLVPRPFAFQRPPLSTQRCKAPPVACFCRHAQAASDHDGTSKLFAVFSHPITAKCCTTVLMFFSLAAGVRAASMYSAARADLRSYDCLPAIRDEAKFFPGLAEWDGLSIWTEKGLDVMEGSNVSCSEVRKHMQMQIMGNCRCDALEVYTDSAFKKLRQATIDKTQDALLHEFCESEMKPTFDSGNWMQSSKVITSGKDANKGKDSLDHSLAGGFIPFKLTVPLRIVSLRGSLPPVWMKNFSLSQSKRVRLSIESQKSLNDIISALRSAVGKRDVKPRSVLAADLVTIGDSWLSLAVSEGLIEPIKAAEEQDWFNELSAQWQDFIRRDQNGGRNSDGLIWGVPYRWGSMVIAYKKDQFLKNNIPPIEDWQDLWRPELQGLVAMVDSPREVVGAVLKSLGASYNAQDFDHDVMGGKEAVKQQFLALQKQVKVFDSIHYLKAFGSDDVWVAVGWSSDVIPVAKRMSNVRVVTPKSGVSLWADLWAIPAASSVSTEKLGSRVRGASPLIHQWFDFCLQPAQSLPFREGVFTGASPQFLVKSGPRKEVAEQTATCDIQEHPFGVVKKKTTGPVMDTNLTEGIPPIDCLEKCELLEPLSEKAVADYRWLFSQALEQHSFRKKLVEKIREIFF